MSNELTFDDLATELETKAKNLGNLNIKLKFIFDGMGTVVIDATKDVPEVSRDASQPADFTITAPLNIWLELRAKKLAPHVAAMTRKIKFEGDLVRGLGLAPKIMSVL